MRIALSASCVSLAAFAIVSVPRPGHACASCGCGDPTLTAAGLDKPYRNRLRLALDVRFGAHTSGAFPTSDTLWTLRYSLLAAWSPTDRLTVTALLPVQSEWLASDTAPTQRFTGLADAELSLRGVVWRDRAFSPSHLLSVTAGLKLPTGPRAYDAAGYPYPEDDQPGSGSFDPFAGVGWVWFGDLLSAYASASWRQTTPTIGRRGYQHGSTLGATAGAQLQPWARFAFGVRLDFGYTLADTMPSTDPQGNPVRRDALNTGGMSLAVTPNLIVSPVDGWLVRLAVQAHAWDRWNGQQSEIWALFLSTVVDLN